MNKPQFIAEIKLKSPYGFQSIHSFETLTKTAIKYGDIISVHTNPLWGGCFEAIEYIRRLTDKPILAKGIHSKNDDVRKALDYGADYVLIVDRFLYDQSDGYNEIPISKILHEIGKNIQDKIYQHPDLKYVYNGRDLMNHGLAKKYLDFKKYRDQTKWLCGASLISDPIHVELFYPNCDAFIVGENLMKFCGILKKQASKTI
jgi:indole-3-glycerol phosphate synthase